MTDFKPDLTHENIAVDFDHLMNRYDLERRLTVLIDHFLSGIDLHTKLVLDAGCGTGHGTQRLKQYDAQVISIDLGEQLTRLTYNRSGNPSAQASILKLPFPAGTYDVVYSSEVIEHTPNPLQAIDELWRVLKPGGWLTLSTPNFLWQFPVRLASLLKIRPYAGYENFLRPQELNSHLVAAGGKVFYHRGIHLLPFQLSFINPVNRFFDHFGSWLLPLMINQAILVFKPTHKGSPGENQ